MTGKLSPARASATIPVLSAPLSQMSRHININNDRRENRRFPLDLQLSYRLRNSGPAVTGSGITVDLSSRGALFRPDGHLQVHDELELAIRWPVLLDGNARLNLVIWGMVVRSDARGCAMVVWGHEFRTRATTRGVRTPAPVENTIPGLFAPQQKPARSGETVRVA